MWRLSNSGTSEVFATLKIGSYTVGRTVVTPEGRSGLLRRRSRCGRFARRVARRRADRGAGISHAGSTPHTLATRHCRPAAAVELYISDSSVSRQHAVLTVAPTPKDGAAAAETGRTTTTLSVVSRSKSSVRCAVTPPRAAGRAWRERHVSRTRLDPATNPLPTPSSPAGGCSIRASMASPSNQSLRGRYGTATCCPSASPLRTRRRWAGARRPLFVWTTSR
jgi:hypothetical protein